MDHETFRRHLLAATTAALSLAGAQVLDALPDAIWYRIYPNACYDERLLVGDEQVYYEEILPSGAWIGPLDAEAVTWFLCRGERIPEWIAIQVQEVCQGRTVMLLRCSPRFTGTEELLDHRAEGFPPFSAMPPEPPSSGEIRTDGKFSLARLDSFF